MPARTEDDRHALLVQEIVGAHDVVVARDLMVDMLHPGLRRAHKRDRVMDRVDPHQRNVADPVADPRVADLRPEDLVTRRIGRIETDMVEAGDAAIARRKVPFPAALRAHGEFDAVAARDRRNAMNALALRWRPPTPFRPRRGGSALPSVRRRPRGSARRRPRSRRPAHAGSPSL